MDTLTTRTLNEWFNEYNNLYFEGKLPKPRFGVKRCKSYLGKCFPTKKTIYMSTFYKRSERGYRETFIHELIHLWNWYQDFCYIGHGKPFKKKAEEINRKGGWNIARCSAIDNEERQTATAKKVVPVYALVIDTNESKDNLHFSIINSQSYDKGEYKNTLRMYADKGWKISLFIASTKNYPTYRVCRTSVTGKYRKRSDIQKDIDDNKLFPMTSFLYKKAI